jgi:transposase
MLNEKVKKYLDELVKEKKSHISFRGERNIAKEIKNILRKDDDYEPTKEDMAEQIAFDFLADYPNDDSGWGTYYGPMFILPNDKGQMVEYPSIKRVDQNMLEYWTQRAKNVKNPILSSRYADLVVDFSDKILTKNADIALFQIVIDSNIAICEESLADPLYCKKKIKRALILAVKTNDQERIIKTKEAIIQLERKVATDDKPGFWGFAFRWLILDFNKKISLKKEEKDELINELEERLKRVEKDTWLTEKAISLLAEYYANEKDEDNLMRVLNILEISLKTNTRINSDALLKVHAYEQIHEIYRKYSSRFAEAEKANKRISQEIGQLDLDWDKSLKEVFIETRIEKEKINSFLNAIFGESRNNELKMVMAKIAINFLPKKDTIAKQLKDISSKQPLEYLGTSQVIADDGIPIAKLSTLEEDYDNHFKKYAFQHIQFASFLLSLAIDELKKRFSKQQIIEHFENSALFENEDKKYLERALSAYWDGDYLISSHLFNPLIESAIRELVKNCGGIILKPNNTGGYDRVLLCALLKNDEIFNSIFSKTGHNILFYFRLVLTEKLGMNLRNDFAHGFGKNKFFGRDASDRRFHVLSLLSLVKKNE